MAQIRRPNLEAALRQKQTADQRLTDQTASVTATLGFINVVGTGEGLFDLKFPVLYTEKPILGYSYDLEEGQVLEPQNFPILSIGVHFYDFTDTPQGIRTYKGARLIIVAAGHDGMKMNVHYRFEGTALANPTSSNAGF